MIQLCHRIVHLFHHKNMIRIDKLSILQRSAIVAGAIILIVGMGLIGSWINIQSQVGSNIYPHTYIDGIDMGNKSKTEALKLLKRRDDYFARAMIEVLYKDIQIATFSGEQLKLTRDIDSKVDQVYQIGRSENISTRIAQQLNALFHYRDFIFTSGIRYSESPIKEFIKIAEETYNFSPENALFSFKNGKVTEFKTHKNGAEIQSEEFYIEINSAIQTITKNQPNKQVLLKEKVVEPTITLAQANNLGIEELIGEGISDYSHSINSRIHNLILAASKFNGLIVQKDAIFSFNTNIGDISSSTGYQPAYIIKEGRTVLGDGGGVCQVSTTMFRAALNTGLPIIERTAHAYRVSYYENDSEPGYDATIFTPSVDFKFKNNTPGAILIQTEVDKANKILSFKFYGQSDGRSVTFSPVTVWDVVPPPDPLYEDDPTQPAGSVRQVDYAAWGAKARFDYKVFDVNNNMTIDKTFTSSYRPWKAVFLRGTGEGI
ncbi:hypothetical protein COY16_01785 [Candidatus Roizmanbacteria bacterium CG_4_10_14_0_2_um_filter_39_13]|uniref:YoaR-like putative peptidoglycan binding domain-containing protein n=1 Tax=Candidatus Roizmanbacteria bacterium CG_4_10_14_0_2_um_filter_39_13 TaxID=1974825 RepID=A0A2M7U0D5_9BACT|nr:MAG: hypothetical protein COY16_01785 [Candidatus Roizmanbacteria bacterium CG_4_10_14_0_2_um_filter_39_13]